MVKSNFKIARRSLWKNKFYTGINLLGISLGIACFVLTYLYVEEELSYDKFHSNVDNIYRVWIHEQDEGDEYFEGVIPVAAKTALETEVPELEQVVQFWESSASFTSPDQLTINTSLTITGQHLFEVFDFKLLAGDRSTALSKMEHIVMTESDAMAYFGRTDVLGETATYTISDKEYSFIVSGVVEDAPDNSSIKYYSFISDLNNERFIPKQSRESWYNFSAEVFVHLRADADPMALESKFPSMVEKYMEDDDEEEYSITIHLQPLSEVHFDTKVDGDTEVGDIRIVRILGIVGFVILILAGINFVNLSVGQSMKRAKEVGVRKVMGAFKNQLIGQFLSESLLLTLMAAILGLGVATLLLPVFNDFADKSLVIEFSAPLLKALGIAIGMIGLLSGAYPALVLSAMKPSSIFRGSSTQGSGKHWLSFSLIVLQFVAAIFFVSTTVVMKDQLNFIASKDLGFDKEAKVYLRLPRPANPGQGMVELMKANALLAEQVITDLRQVPSIEKVGFSNNYFGDEGWMFLEYADQQGEDQAYFFNTISKEFIDLFGIEMVTGKDFSEATAYELQNGILVNETFVKTHAMEDPVGKKIDREKQKEHQIIGVVKDFHFASLHKKVEPLVMAYNPGMGFSGIRGITINQATRATVVAQVRLEEMVATRKAMQEIWEARFTQPFDLRFIDTKLERLYEQEARTNSMVSLIAILAIIIASLGLLGLAALTIRNRFKEIGIRKVLGARPADIFGLLYKVFASPVFVAFVISVPITVMVMRSWLGGFAYHVDVNLLHFVITACAVLIVTVLVISYQSVKAASMNPVDTIRYE